MGDPDDARLATRHRILVEASKDLDENSVLSKQRKEIWESKKDARLCVLQFVSAGDLDHGEHQHLFILLIHGGLRHLGDMESLVENSLEHDSMLLLLPDYSEFEPPLHGLYGPGTRSSWQTYFYVGGVWYFCRTMDPNIMLRMSYLVLQDMVPGSQRKNVFRCRPMNYLLVLILPGNLCE